MARQSSSPRLIRRIVTVGLAVAVGLVGSVSTAAAAAPAAAATNPYGGGVAPCRTPAACYAAAYASYIYTLPLAMTVYSSQFATNVAQADPPGVPNGRAPINQMTANPLPTAANNQIVLPSVSTPYSNAFLDIGPEPMVLSIPDISTTPLPGGGNRFFLFQVLDAWTQVGGDDRSCLRGREGFCDLGTRYGTKGGNYLFARTGWKGKVPRGITQVIRVDTDRVWIAGRTLTDGSADDLTTTLGLQKQYTLTPLSSFGKPYTPPNDVPTDPSIDPTVAPVDFITGLNYQQYFSRVAGYLTTNPPREGDRGAVRQMGRIGLSAGTFAVGQFDPTLAAAIGKGYADARTYVEAQSAVPQPGSQWVWSLRDGAWRPNAVGYLQRALVAYSGLGANLYKDAVYMGTGRDGAANRLGGGSCYTLTFAAGALPPADPQAFWSVTLYNNRERNLFDSSASGVTRNGVGVPATQGNSLKPDADGSITIHIQPMMPQAGLDSGVGHNWLPSPPLDAPGGDAFILLFRMYMPQQRVLNGQWIPPDVQQATCV